MRSIRGSSLVEMLVCTTIMAFVSLSFVSILLVNYKTNSKVSSMEDTVSAVRIVKERIGKDIREGRTMGDVFGHQMLAAVPGTSIPMTYVRGSDIFPDSTRNPIYGGTLPFVPAGWTSPPWKLSNTCLVVQIPVLDNHKDDVSGQHVHDQTKTGWPTSIPVGYKSTSPLIPETRQENVETHVYQVLPDPANPGEWMMQMASYAGIAVPGYVPAVHTAGPQTLVTGIVGPMDQNTGVPKVFQYISRIDASGKPHDQIDPDGSHATEYTGVIVNLEVRRHQSIVAARSDLAAKPIGMKLEVFLRNNATATSVGQPSDISGIQ